MRCWRLFAATGVLEGVNGLRCSNKAQDRSEALNRHPTDGAPDVEAVCIRGSPGHGSPDQRQSSAEPAMRASGQPNGRDDLPKARCRKPLNAIRHEACI